MEVWAKDTKSFAQSHMWSKLMADTLQHSWVGDPYGVCNTTVSQYVTTGVNLITYSHPIKKIRNNCSWWLLANEPSLPQVWIGDDPMDILPAMASSWEMVPLAPAHRGEQATVGYPGCKRAAWQLLRDNCCMQALILWVTNVLQWQMWKSISISSPRSCRCWVAVSPIPFAYPSLCTSFIILAKL